MDKKLCLSSRDRKIAGVCGGIAEYFHLEPSLVRIIWLVLIFLMRGFPILLYIICWAVMPNEF